jgi:hypothetical protein
VVDHRGVLQGIITLDDIIEWMSEQLAAATSLIEHQRHWTDSVGTKRA